MVAVLKKLCPPGLKNNPEKLMKSVEYITVHCTGNYSPAAGAKNHADYLYGGSGGQQASWHYTVDGREIWQSFEDNRICWHAGDGTAGPGNSSSIGIEICVNSRAEFLQACQNAAELAASLLDRYNLNLNRVVQHNSWSGKNCPYELRTGIWGVTWGDFTAMVKARLKPAAIATNPETEQPPGAALPSWWAVDAWVWAAAAGITDGTNPQGPVTREQAVTMLHRYFLL